MWGVRRVGLWSAARLDKPYFLLRFSKWRVDGKRTNSLDDVPYQSTRLFFIRVNRKVWNQYVFLPVRFSNFCDAFYRMIYIIKLVLLLFYLFYTLSRIFNYLESDWPEFIIYNIHTNIGLCYWNRRFLIYHFVISTCFYKTIHSVSEKP